MNNAQEPSLQWLAEQQFEEQRSLRAAEDNLFNWSTSLLVASVGALTSFKGFATGDWGFWWRLLLEIGILGVIGVILMMAYLIRRNYKRATEELQEMLAQVRSAAGIKPRTSASEDELFFYLRWSAVAGLGVVAMFMVWLLG